MNLIHFRCELANPFVPEYFKNLGSVWGRISNNWAWELEHTFYSSTLVDIEINLSIKTDHHGLRFVFGILGYGIHFHVYNVNHYVGDE